MEDDEALYECPNCGSDNVGIENQRNDIRTIPIIGEPPVQTSRPLSFEAVCYACGLRKLVPGAPPARAVRPHTPPADSSALYPGSGDALAPPGGR